MSSAAVNPGAIASYVFIILTPKGALRIIALIFCIIYFAISVDSNIHRVGSDLGNAIVTCGAITLVWCVLVLVSYLMGRLLLAHVKLVSIIELIIDVALAIFTIGVAIKFASDIQKAADVYKQYNIPGAAKALEKPRAITAFLFLTFFTFIGSIILGVMSILKPQAEQTADAAK